MKRNCVNNECSIKEDCANWIVANDPADVSALEPFKGKGDEDCPDLRMVSCGATCAWH